MTLSLNLLLMLISFVQFGISNAAGFFTYFNKINQLKVKFCHLQITGLSFPCITSNISKLSKFMIQNLEDEKKSISANSSFGKFIQSYIT